MNHKKNPRRQPEAGYFKALEKLYASNSTPAPLRVKRGSIVTFTLVPSVRMEVLEVQVQHALLRMANGTCIRAELERLVVVS
ncbi:hypothetical protein [Thioalkalivibrio sulfidiphilus]|uniref:hypothetical protein n=1 Tax=Thioalkalivibrio sulfidiphilus TaxID=1033854 RepID=UPI003B34658F